MQTPWVQSLQEAVGGARSSCASGPPSSRQRADGGAMDANELAAACRHAEDWLATLARRAADAEKRGDVARAEDCWRAYQELLQELAALERLRRP